MSNTTENTDQSVATEHAQPLQRSSLYECPLAFQPLPAALAEGASASGPAEHNAPAAQLALEPKLLDLSELPAIRAAALHDQTRDALHDQARETLNAFAAAPYDGPTCLNDLFPWKAYLALHAESEMIVGPGISRAVVDELKDVKDPNRGGRPRTDFIFYRVDGSACRVHPGTERKMMLNQSFAHPVVLQSRLQLASGTRRQWKVLRTSTRVEFHKPTSWARNKLSKPLRLTQSDSSGGCLQPTSGHTLNA